MRFINFWTLGILLLLTLTSYFISGQVIKTTFVYVLTILTVTKVLLVALQYMELRKAHGAWISAIIVVLVIYGGIIIFFYQ